MRHNQSVQLQLQSRVYFDMLDQLRKTGDRRPFEHGLYEDFPVSPDAWIKSVTGQVRNAWRDIWIRRSISDCWMRAASWRATHKVGGLLDCAERRRQHRRSTD